jgi:parallel beta-helix repeat protein
MFENLSRLKVMSLCCAVLFALSASPLHAQPFENGPFLSLNCDALGADLQRVLDAAPTGATVILDGTTCDDGPYYIRGKDLVFRSVSSGTATLSTPSGGRSVLEVEHAHADIININIDASNADVGINVRGATVDLRRVVVEGSPNAGLRVVDSSFASIFDCEFRNNAVGIEISTSSSFDLADNSVVESNNGFGVLVLQSSSGTIAESTLIDDNQNGVVVGQNSSITMNDSTITNNTGSGVQVQESSVIAFGGGQIPFRETEPT